MQSAYDIENMFWYQNDHVFFFLKGEVPLIQIKYTVKLPNLEHPNNIVIIFNTRLFEEKPYFCMKK